MLYFNVMTMKKVKPMKVKLASACWSMMTKWLLKPKVLVGCLEMVEPVVAPDADQGLVLTNVVQDHDVDAVRTPWPPTAGPAPTSQTGASRRAFWTRR